jgi:hypothetical protein
MSFKGRHENDIRGQLDVTFAFVNDVNYSAIEAAVFRGLETYIINCENIFNICSKDINFISK